MHFHQSRPTRETQKKDGARAAGGKTDTDEEKTSDVLSPEEFARWEGVAAGGDRTQARFARIVLKRHAEAVAAQTGAPG
jgi:hypothetical protein